MPFLAPLVPIIANVAITAAVSYGVGAITSALSPKPEPPDVTAKKPKTPKKKASSPHAKRTIEALDVDPDPSGPHVGIFGYRRVGGRIVAAGKKRASTYFIIEIAGAPVQGIPGVYINDQLVTLDSNGDVLDYPWYQNGKASINVITYDGTQTAADPVMAAAFDDWTSASKGTKIAYARVRINKSLDPVFDDAFGSGVPDFTFDVLGHGCYDPRGVYDIGDPTSWPFSDNAAIIQANYLIHALGMGLSPSLVDWASVTEAANICDELVALNSGGSERRYTCAVHWTTDTPHDQVIAKIGAAHAGGIITPGGLFKVYTGSYVAPTVAITPAMYAAGGLSWSELAPLADRINGVRGTFSSRQHAFEPRDFPSYQDATARAADGTDRWDDIDLECVTSHTQAQRLARIHYYSARNAITAEVETTLAGFNIVAGDMVALNDDMTGYASLPMRVESDALGPDMTCRFTLRYESGAHYAWTPATDEKAFLEASGLRQSRWLSAPGGALIDSNAAAGTVGPNVYFYDSESPAGDFTSYRTQERDGTGAVLREHVAVQTANNSVLGFSFATGGNLNEYRVRAEDTSTGLASDWCVVQTYNTRASAAIDGKNETNTPAYALPQPRTPNVATIGAGSAVLNIYAGLGSQISNIEILENTVLDALSASVVNTRANGDGTYAVSGAAGTVKYYWVRYRNAGSTVYSPLSKPLLVVF